MIIVELTMTTPVGAQVGTQPSGLVAISRAVVSAAAELLVSVERAMVGEDKVRTARGNAWDALCADRARAQARDDMEQLVRSLMANGPHHATPGPATHSRSAEAPLRARSLTSAGASSH
jgi:hypothetical protein